MLYVLLFYILFLALFAVYSFVAIYHLYRFGYIGDLTKPAIFFYLTIVLIIIALTLAFVFTRSWPADFNV